MQDAGREHGEEERAGCCSRWASPISGKSRTPGGGTDLAAMMGKEETVKRVKAALEKL